MCGKLSCRNEKQANKGIKHIVRNVKHLLKFQTVTIFKRMLESIICYM
jgi:hypothetical protein